MNNLKKSLIASSAIVALSLSSATFAAYGLPEQAQPAPVAPVSNDAWYVGAFGGLTYTPSISGNSIFIINSTTAFANRSFDNPNWDVGAHVGYRMGQIRLEGEYIFQRSTLNRVSDGVTFTDTARLNVHSGMFNALYDIEGLTSSVLPYIGAGIGVASLSLNDNFTNLRTGAVISNSSGSNTRFAYQVLAGVGFKVMDNVNMNVGYRYFGTTSGDNDDFVAGTGFRSARFQNHLFNIGIDYFFG
jgi:opacity protein-like surface antigen